MRLHPTLALCVCLFASACGGSAAAPKEPETSTESAAVPEAGAEKPADGEKPGEPAAEDKPDSAASDATTSSGPTMTRTARDILTAPDTLFMLSFNESDVKQKAEEACDGKVKNDPKKRAECMSREKEKIDADGLGFKEEKGTWFFSTIKRKGKVLNYIHKVSFEFAKEEPNKVVLKITGRDTGTKPTKFPNEITIEVPNDYQIVLNDPQHGKMVYEAKIGLLSK